MRMVTFYMDDDTRRDAQQAAIITASRLKARKVNVAEFYRTAIAREARRVIDRHERRLMDDVAK